MLVLDNAGVGNIALGVVHNGVTLEIGFVDDFLLKAHGAVVELTEAVAVELVYFSREDNRVGKAFPVSPVIKEVGTGLCLNAAEQTFYKFIVASDGYALVLVVKVVVVEHEADGQTLDDKCWQIGTLV